MTGLVLGFLIALGVGLTGTGGGSFTVPALLLLVGCQQVKLWGPRLFLPRFAIDRGTILSVRTAGAFALCAALAPSCCRGS
jgi:uncharacterized membrane protein YfcA